MLGRFGEIAHAGVSEGRKPVGAELGAGPSEQLEKLDRKPVFSSGSYCIISCGRRAALDLEAVHRAATKPGIVTPFTPI
jgi:hypothetical protein